MAFNKNKVMDAARKFVEKGQVDKAIKEYLRIVREDPKDVRVWLKIGDLYAKKGAKQEATETYLKVAKFYGEQGFYLKAVAVYKQILKLDARLVEVNLKLAELYRQLGLVSDAMQHFEMVAAHFHREGKTKEALATVRQLVDLDPDNIATRIKLAELYSKEGMVEEAVGEFSHACEYLRAHNRQDDFIKVAERLLWHKPDNIELNRELATLYLRRNDPRRALQKLQVCFKADSRDVETLALLAQAFQSLDQKSKTVSVLKELARVLHESGQRPQAEDVHRKILMYVPEDPDSLAYLGEGRRAEPARAQAAGSPMQAPPERVAITSSDLPQRGGLNPTGSMPLVSGVPEVDEDEVGFEPEVLEEEPVVEAEDDFVADLSLDDDASYDTGSVAGEAHADEIVKILTESDVYVKYGLHQKAVDHLRRIFELDPNNLEASERLKDIFLSQGREGEALEELVKLAEHTATSEPDRAEGYLREVLAIDGGYQPALHLARRFRLEVTSTPEVEIIDESGERLDLDAGGVAPVEDDIDFDDIDFGDSGEVLIPEGAATPEYGYALPDDLADDEGTFELDLDDALESAEEALGDAPAPDPSGTMEVSVDQVEEMVPLGDDLDELDFDGGLVAEPAPAGFAPAIPAEDDALGDFELPAEGPPFDPHAAAAFDAEPVDPPTFDPDAARAFDADVAGQDLLAPDPHSLDAEPIADMSDFELPLSSGTAPSMASAPPSADYGDEGGATLFAPPVIDDDPQAAASPELGVPDELDLLGESGPAEAAGGALEDDLDEADFFVNQGLYSEARDILAGLLERYPNHPLVMAKMQDVDAMDVAAAGGYGEAEAGDGYPEDVSATVQSAPEGEESSRPSVMLEKPVDDEDADTHYDLGLAYKEMGLYEEAIKSFSKVMEVPGREVQVRLMVGLCYREQGSYSEAIHQFKAGLHSSEISEREKYSLFYEIGCSYEALSDAQEALYYFEMVLKKDVKFRDVASRVSQLQAGANGTATRRSKPAPEDTDSAIDSLLAETSD